VAFYTIEAGMKKPQKLEAEGLWNYAVRTLSGRAHSAGELKAKLRNRAARAGDIDGVIARLKDVGYLNDRQFAESFAASRMENQRLGRLRVLRDLRSRRVAPALAEQTLDKVYQGTDEAELVEEYLRRKLRIEAKPLVEEKQIAAAFRRLVRAGFRRGTVVTVLKRHVRDAEALDAAESAGEERPEE
jgi:regulatory protein